MFKLRQIAQNIFVRPLCRTNFFWSEPTFSGSRSWSHNIKCRTIHIAHTVHTTTTTTRFMSHNHVVSSRTTKFLSVWTHLNIPLMWWQNTDIGWNGLMLQCCILMLQYYTLLLLCYSYNLTIYPCSRQHYITVLHYMCVPTLRIFRKNCKYLLRKF